MKKEVTKEVLMKEEKRKGSRPVRVEASFSFGYFERN